MTETFFIYDFYLEIFLKRKFSFYWCFKLILDNIVEAYVWLYVSVHDECALAIIKAKVRHDTINHNPKYGVRNLREPKIVAVRQLLKIAKK